MTSGRGSSTRSAHQRDCAATATLQDRIVGLATGVALALLGLRLRHGLNVSTEILPWHDLLDRLQRIALGADRLQPAPNIEKARLPHDSLAPPNLWRRIRLLLPTVCPEECANFLRHAGYVST